MAKCDQRTAASSLPTGCSAAASRLFSDAALRRRLLSALICGASHRPKPSKLQHPPPPPPTQHSLDPSGSRRSRCSDRLSDLFKVEHLNVEDDDARRKMEELRCVVARLGFGGDRREAAEEVRRRARDGGVEAREALLAAGVIGPLVAISDSGDDDLKVTVLYALLNLGIGSDANKAAIVHAGALEKILILINSNPSPSLSEAIVANLLGLSALDSNKPLIGSCPAVPFLINIFQSHLPLQPKLDSLRALFNLSLSPINATYLIEQDLVPALLSSLGDMELSDRSLAILSNLVSSSYGRIAISSYPDGYPILIDVLNWTDSSECQEKAAYILMVMAHKAGAGDRAAMVEAGIVSSLLEVMLVGSALVQKRAARVLECLRAEKGKQVSEGFEGRGNGVMIEMESVVEEGVMSDEKRALRELVRQSLQNNLRRIVSRANLQHNFAPSDRYLGIAGTSKSLPL